MNEQSVELNISLHDYRPDKSCLADIILPESGVEISDFLVKPGPGDGVQVHMPAWMNSVWTYPQISWQEVREQVIRAYRLGLSQDYEASSLSEQAVDADAEESVRKSRAPKDTNPYGRIKNADQVLLRYVPNSVLRKDEAPKSDAAGQEKAPKKDLVAAMIRGSSQGGFGPFEISLLEWIGKLRYSHRQMFLDLIAAQHIFGQWGDVPGNLNRILSRMEDYNLIDITRFVSLDEDGQTRKSGGTNSRFITLGSMGGVLLREQGIRDIRYNKFDLIRDGNDIKRYLAANQWLVYFLTAFSDEVTEYHTAMTLLRRRDGIEGARLYASVIVNDVPLVAEAVRRCAASEAEYAQQELTGKFRRFLSLFSDLDHLYLDTKEFHFSQRPILVYICEDDRHVQETYDILFPLLMAHPEQEVWFTTDRRIFNYDYIGKRFLAVSKQEMKVINLASRLGIEEIIDEEGQAHKSRFSNEADFASKEIAATSKEEEESVLPLPSNELDLNQDAKALADDKISTDEKLSTQKLAHKKKEETIPEEKPQESQRTGRAEGMAEKQPKPETDFQGRPQPQDNLHGQDGHADQDGLKAQDVLQTQDRLRTQDALKTQDRLRVQDELQTQDELYIQDSMQTQDGIQIPDELLTQDRRRIQDGPQTQVPESNTAQTPDAPHAQTHTASRTHVRTQPETKPEVKRITRRPLWFLNKEPSRRKTLLECYDMLKEKQLADKWMQSAEEASPRQVEKAVSSFAEGLDPAQVQVIVDPSGSRTGKKCCLFTDSALYSSDLKGVEGNMIRYDSILDVQWSGADFITILLTTGKICTLDLGKANTSLVQLLKELVLS